MISGETGVRLEIDTGDRYWKQTLEADTGGRK